MHPWLPAGPLELAGYALGLLVAAPCFYLLCLTPPAIVERLRGRRPPGPGEGGHLVFVIPAHDEEADIEGTLGGLCAVADDDSSIHVVADNCTDRTAELARAFAANAPVVVEVWERHDDSKRAKGYALEWALPRVFEWAEERRTPAAFVCIVDADATLSEGSVERARAGFAAGHTVLQSEYIFGKGLGLRAEVMRIASAALAVRGIGRAALGLSDTLKGNGMWFRREVLAETPWTAYSLAEDLEYTMRILDEGHTVHVLAGSQVSGKLAATEKGETEQRLRWEGGRWAVVRVEVPKLLRRLLKSPSLARADMLLELTIPPLGLLVSLQALALAALALVPGFGWAVVLSGWAALGIYVVAGVVLAGLPLRSLLAMAYVPFYVLWKLVLLPRTLLASRSKRWVRTSR